MIKPNFFISGNSTDWGYCQIRDNPKHENVRNFIDSLWSRYYPYADDHFLEDARNHFQERFWEMYVGVTLLDRQFQLYRASDSGPEFYFLLERRKVWFEAIAPGPGVGPDYVPQPPLGEASAVPTEKILLRFTSALAEKRNKYLIAKSKGIIAEDDLYILAINSRKIPHAPFGSTMPYYVQALLPFGNPAIAIDKKTMEVVDSYYQYRSNIAKANGQSISTLGFLNLEFSFMTAVLHSSVDCVNHPDMLGGDFSILHNPNASNPLERRTFSWIEQFVVSNDSLERIKASL